MKDLVEGAEHWKGDGFNGTGMSNFDNEIREGFEEALRAAPGKIYGLHAGWNFNGLVWFDGENFVEQPWTYGTPNAPISAPTLRELMDAVNDRYGWD